jgi:hypothetical protein
MGRTDRDEFQATVPVMHPTHDRLFYPDRPGVAIRQEQGELKLPSHLKRFHGSRHTTGGGEVHQLRFPLKILLSKEEEAATDTDPPRFASFFR